MLSQSYKGAKVVVGEDVEESVHISHVIIGKSMRLTMVRCFTSLSTARRSNASLPEPRGPEMVTKVAI